MKGDCKYLCNPEYVVNVLVFFMIYTLCLYWFTLFRKIIQFQTYNLCGLHFGDFYCAIFLLDNPWSVLLNESMVRNNDRIVNFQVNYPRHVHTN